MHFPGEICIFFPFFFFLQGFNVFKGTIEKGLKSHKLKHSPVEKPLVPLNIDTGQRIPFIVNIVELFGQVLRCNSEAKTITEGAHDAHVSVLRSSVWQNVNWPAMLVGAHINTSRVVGGFSCSSEQEHANPVKLVRRSFYKQWLTFHYWMYCPFKCETILGLPDLSSGVSVQQ